MTAGSHIRRQELEINGTIGSLEKYMAQPSEQFQGDMSRNEVEIDLNKFMAMVAEIGELKDQIRTLENDKEPDNPWQRWIWLSQMVDSWRIFPRM